MTHRLLMFSYWFPPNNVIGASRGSAIALYFADLGWSVTVIAADSGAASKDFDVNLTGIEVHRVKDTVLTGLMNFRTGRKRWQNALSALLRYSAFPDAFRSTTLRMELVAEQLTRQGAKYDIVLSTALPFSQHAVASRIARKTDALLVLDNRDTWACNSYRRKLPFAELWERRYEHAVLSSADIVTSISDGMTAYFKEQYPDIAQRFYTIRNGVDNALLNSLETVREKGQVLRVVYTGILYGTKRDISPILEAACASKLPIVFDFYGSEPDRVAALKLQFPTLQITDHGRVPRSEAVAAQRNADALLVGLGQDVAEKTFLPGKFFEYVGSGRPIIVIADSDYEISRLVDEHGLGIASRNVEALTSFLCKLSTGEIATHKFVPAPLTRDFQLGILQRMLVAALADTN